jgi:hypothetical protein
VLERIDGAEGNGISVEALARMSYSYLQRHSAFPFRLLGLSESCNMEVVVFRLKREHLGTGFRQEGSTQGSAAHGPAILHHSEGRARSPEQSHSRSIPEGFPGWL